MSTIREVAKLAGVAPITVSRVLNKKGPVRPETRARVEAAAAALNYVPNMLARSFRSQRTETLGLILSDITNPFWTTVARGVEDVASRQGFNVIFCNTDENHAKQEQYLALLLQRRVDGILLVPARSTPDAVLQVQSQNVPIVVLDRRVPGVEVDVVRGTSTKGAQTLVEHLLALGHRRIAAFSGPADISSSEERIQGYRQALLAAGVIIEPELIFQDQFSIAGGMAMAERFLELAVQPSAIFAGNNFVALGALQRLTTAGYTVPDDISLVSFDDVPSYYMVDPFLTVVAQPAYEMGERAAEMLLQRIMDPSAGPPREVTLPTQLIVRKSARERSAQIEEAPGS